jgi:RNA-directed DNA polymerase
MDLEKFFDRVNHDKVMSEVGKRVSDRRINNLIKRYLRIRAGIETLIIAVFVILGVKIAPFITNVFMK